MELCIFCQSKPPGPKKPEHILLNALGGRKVTRTAICDDCNSEFGSGPDLVLAESAQLIRNIADLKSGTGKPPPAIKRVTVSGVRYDVAPGFRPKYNPTEPMKFSKTAEGDQFEIRAGSLEQFEKMLNAAAAKMRMTEEEKSQFKKDAFEKAKLEERPAPVFKNQLSLGCEKSQQSMVKAALVLWADFVGNAEVNKRDYDGARHFAKTGDTSKLLGNLPVLDSRAVPVCVDEFGPHPNVICVASTDAGKVVAYFSLYALAGWRYELCANDAPPNTRICLISNPIQPEHWKCASDVGPDISAEWISANVGNDVVHLEAISEKMRALINYSRKKSIDEALNEMVETSFKELGIGVGDIVDGQSIDRFAHILANRFTHFALKIPRSTPLKRPVRK